MKILLLTDRMDAGGAETHIAGLAEGLVKLGADVCLLSHGGQMADLLKEKGVRILHAPMHSHRPRALLQSYWILRKLLKREHFDVIHAHARVPAFVLRFCKPAQTACIVSVHAAFRNHFLLKRLCYWGERTIAVSEDLRAYVCRTYGVAPTRVCVIPNCIDCHAFSPLTSAPRTDDPAILFASRLDDDCAHGAELLCQIAPALYQRFPEIRIAIAGGGNRYHHIRRLAEIANRQIGHATIEMLGWVSDMPALLRQYDIFVGVSRAAMEASACGCSVILCGNQGYGGILTEQTAKIAALCNFCARGEAQATADRLTRDLTDLLEHPAARHRYATQMQCLIENQFNQTRTCRETLAIYHRAQHTPTRLTVVIGGYFGCGNLGDDAILLGFLEGLHTIAPHIRVIALTRTPRRNQKRFGITCVNRKNPFAIARIFSHSDAFFCGGGSLLQNITSNRSLSYYLSLLSLARRSHCQPLLYAAGIGPIKGSRSIQRTIKNLSKCPYISLRDEDSARFLSALKIDAAHLHLGADPACLMASPSPTRADALLQQHGVDVSCERICIVLSGSAPTTRIKQLITALRMVCKHHALTPIFLVLDRQIDLHVSQKAAKALGGTVIAPSDPTDAIALISVCRAVLSLRLHALIFATSVKIPALGISANAQDGKIAAFARNVGQDFLAPDTLTVPALVGAIESVINDRYRRAPILCDAIMEMRRTAHEDLQRICNFLEHKN